MKKYLFCFFFLVFGLYTPIVCHAEEFETGDGCAVEEYDISNPDQYELGNVKLMGQVENTKEGILEVILFNETLNINVNVTILPIEKYRKILEIPTGVYRVEQIQFKGCSPCVSEVTKNQTFKVQNGKCPIVKFNATYDEKDEIGTVSYNGGKSGYQLGKEMQAQMDSEEEATGISGTSFKVTKTKSDIKIEKKPMLKSIIRFMSQNLFLVLCGLILLVCIIIYFIKYRDK